VVLTVQSPGEAPRKVMLVRERIQSPLLIQSSLLPTSDGSRIGYIFLPTFFDITITDQVEAALEGFGKLDGLILDNRLNGGGSSAVVEPLLSFFASGTLGKFASRSASQPLTIQAQPIHNSQTVPLVILVGEDTVSFGEIFSGVLKDAGRAQIAGQPTLGNVEILHGYEFDDGSRLWIAEDTFVPANSQEDWEITGIVPDLVVHADWDTFTFENDPVILAALQMLGH
jgi:C-terminal processing protease CtpA/Prc